MTGHRERKKQETKQALIKSAYELFAQKGYNATTLADITAKANYAPRTFFQYFTSKEDLLLLGIDEIWEDLAKALAERPSGVTTLQAIKAWMLNITKRYLEHSDPLLVTLGQEISDIHTSAKARRALYSIERMQMVLIPAFAKDLGMSQDAAEPRLLAIAAAAVFDAHHHDPVLAGIDEMVIVDMSTKVLEGAVASLAQKS